MGTRFTGFFVTNPLILPQNCVAFAMVNPLAGPDHEVAGWFHAHLTRAFVSVLRAFTEFGSSEWFGAVLFCAVLLIALLGFSRIALGAHFSTDVFAATVFGLLWLACCSFAAKPMRRSVVLTPAAPLVSEPVFVRVEETGPPAQSLLS